MSNKFELIKTTSKQRPSQIPLKKLAPEGRMAFHQFLPTYLYASTSEDISGLFLCASSMQLSYVPSASEHQRTCRGKINTFFLSTHFTFPPHSNVITFNLKILKLCVGELKSKFITGRNKLTVEPPGIFFCLIFLTIQLALITPSCSIQINRSRSGKSLSFSSYFSCIYIYFYIWIKKLTWMSWKFFTKTTWCWTLISVPKSVHLPDRRLSGCDKTTRLLAVWLDSIARRSNSTSLFQLRTTIWESDVTIQSFVSHPHSILSYFNQTIS